jgi:hypothetical protein
MRHSPSCVLPPLRRIRNDVRAIYAASRICIDLGAHARRFSEANSKLAGGAHASLLQRALLSAVRRASCPRVHSPGSLCNSVTHFSMGGIHHRLKPTAGEIETRYAG